MSKLVKCVALQAAGAPPCGCPLPPGTHWGLRWQNEHVLGEPSCLSLPTNTIFSRCQTRTLLQWCSFFVYVEILCVGPCEPGAYEARQEHGRRSSPGALGLGQNEQLSPPAPTSLPAHPLFPRHISRRSLPRGIWTSPHGVSTHILIEDWLWFDHLQLASSDRHSFWCLVSTKPPRRPWAFTSPGGWLGDRFWWGGLDPAGVCISHRPQTDVLLILISGHALRNKGAEDLVLSVSPPPLFPRTLSACLSVSFYISCLVLCAVI